MRARSSMPCLLLRSPFPVQVLECSYPFCLLQYLFCHAMQVAVCARFGWPGLFCALVRENPPSSAHIHCRDFIVAAMARLVRLFCSRERQQ